MKTFIEQIRVNANVYPNVVALQHKKKQLTYFELYTRMQQVVVGCRDNGILPGSNVLFACKPDVESLSLALGLLQAGVTLTIIDPFTTDDLFKNRAVKANVTHSVADPILYFLSKHRTLFTKITKKPLANFISIPAIPLCFGKTKEVKNVKTWFNTLNPGDQVFIEPKQAVIVFTSGTTSEPKGVVHTLESLSANVEEFSRLFGVTPGSKIYSEPMTLGLIALSQGATWVIPAGEKQIPTDCDVWFGTPVDILKGLPASRGANLKVIGSGAAPILPSFVEEVNKVHPQAEIKCVYGMTEILPIAVGDARLKSTYVGEGDYIGLPLNNTTVKIVDREVYVKSSALMSNYLDQPPVDFLPTGDYGFLLEQTGELVLTGRKKDMFIRGDMNVYPGLYEPGLSQIKGVNEVVMVGVPDKYGDDEIVIVASPKPGVDAELLKQTVEKEMVKKVDSKAIPSRVVILPVLPKRGRADKIDRPKIVELVS